MANDNPAREETWGIVMLDGRVDNPAGEVIRAGTGTVLVPPSL